MQSPSPITRADASYNRRRAGTACNVCRSRKTKCDNRRPVCGFCAATGGECSYNDESQDHSRLDRGSLLILQRIGELEQSLAKLITGAETGVNSSASPDPCSVLSPSAVADAAIARPPPARPAHQDLKREEVAPIAESGTGEGDNPPTADIIHASTEMTVESLLAWPIFQAVLPEPYPPLPSLLSQAGQQVRIDVSSLDYDFTIDSQAVGQLVENFLSSNHVKNPIFDVATLWEDVRLFIDTGPRWDGRSCLILLICAVSIMSAPMKTELHAGPSKHKERRDHAEAYFREAQKRLGLVYTENSLLVLQCSFLTSVYLMSTLNIFAAWKSFSQAGTQCVGWLAARGRVRGSAADLTPPMGDPSESHSRYVEESIYWSCLKSELLSSPGLLAIADLELRTELGLPGSSLNEMRYPNVYPSPPVAAPLPWDSSSEVNERARSELEIGWFFYLAEIALRRIMNDVLTTRYQPTSWYYRSKWWTGPEEHQFVSYVKEFEQKLTSWYNTLPPSMYFSQDPTMKSGDILRGILRGHLVDIREVVYFPSLRAFMTKPLGDIGHQTVQIARRALENDLHRIMECQEGFYIRHQGTWLMIRTCTRSSLHLLAVGLRSLQEPEVADLLPEGWKPAVGSILRLIDYWQDESPDLVVLLRTLRNICSHLDIQ